MANLSIRNMVCQRCVTAVKKLLSQLGLSPTSVSLGEVHLRTELPADVRRVLQARLHDLGFELLDDRRSRQILRIKEVISSEINKMDGHRFSFPEVLARELNKEYSQLSKLFSQVEGITVEQHVIVQKVEKAKELMLYNNLSLKEIATRLCYSSVAHLSSQFKKTTGMTPTQFKALTKGRAKFLR